jgi:predicted SAM-dependent methyltransferase
MKYINIGCGSHYSKLPEWVNLDFNHQSNDVITHNLLNGIPYPDNSFDLVYHSHVLEHFSKQDGIFFIHECFRVLKTGGIIRVVVPDLEQIARNYLRNLELGLNNPNDEKVNADYNWMVIEMYDQTVRNKSGGMMADYLFQEHIVNEHFVFERIGEEGKSIRNAYLNNKKNIETPKKNLKTSIKKLLKRLLTIRSNKYYDLGKFRLQGEIHQWMYDRYSLSKLLQHAGFQSIIQRNAFDSYILDWDKYELDGKEGIVRKPDSVFIEAQKIEHNFIEKC